MSKKEKTIKAFVPTKDTLYEVDGEEHTVYKDVIYLVPHTLSHAYAKELERQGRGSCIFDDKQ